MSDPPEARILHCWTVNAAPWIEAIRSGSIQSRKQVTDRAVVDAVTSVHAARVLDIGCGEGWLARALTARGVAVTEPAPWYFRTVASWLSMLGRCGFELLGCLEPTAPGASKPASVIFIGRRSRA
jgi:hypothetical protein